MRDVARELERLQTHRLHVPFALLESPSRNRSRRGIGCRGEVTGGEIARRYLGVVSRFQCRKNGRLRRADGALVCRIEQQRRPDKQVEREDEDTDEEYEGLQRDLPVRTDELRAARFVHGLRGEVPLHLTLIRPEVREHKEGAADDAGPERVGVVQIEREVINAETPGRAGDVQRGRRRDRKLDQERDDDGDQRACTPPIIV